MFAERIIPDQQYWDSYQSYTQHVNRYRFAARFLAPTASVLDLGTGCGYGAAHLAEAPARTVLGVDLCWSALQYGRQRYGLWRLDFLRGCGSRLPVKNGSLDAVVALEILEHVANPEALLEEARRVLKPTGVLVASTPNRSVTGSGGVPDNPHHFKEYTTLEFKELLSPAFRHIALYGQHHTPAFLVYAANMGRLWRLLGQVRDQAHAVMSRVDLDERLTGLALLKKLGRLWGRRGSQNGWDANGALSLGALYPPAGLDDWDITAYRIDEAPVLVAVCRP